MSGLNSMMEDPKLKSAANSSRAQRILDDGHNTSVELERAIRELNVALQLVPSNIENHMNLAATFCRAYDWSSAVFSLRFVLHADAKNEKARLELCRVYTLMGKEMMTLKLYEEAVAHFKNAIKYDPSFVEGWTLMAKCFVYLKDFKSAIEVAGRSISLAGATTAELFVFRAKLYWAVGLEAPGNTDMRRALDMDRNHPEVLGFLARSFQRAQVFYNNGMEKLSAGDNMGALTCMEQAIQLSRDDIKLYLTMAKIYRLVGELDKALFTLQDAVGVYKARHAEDHPPEEEDSLDGSEESDSDSDGSNGSGGEASINDNDSKIVPPKRPYTPGIPPLILKQMNLVYNDMALRLAGEGEYGKAINLLHKVISSERERATLPGSETVDYRYFMNRGDCYRAQGETFYATSDYHSALEINPEAWEIRTKLSLIHYQHGVDHFNTSNFVAATNELNECIRLNNRVCDYYLLRGRANYYQGYYHDACEDFKCAKKIDPTNARVLEYLSLFGHGVLEETEQMDKSRLAASLSAASTRRPLKKILSKTESLDKLRRKNERQRKLNKSLSSCTIVRNLPKQDIEVGAKGITAYMRNLPPLSGGGSNPASSSNFGGSIVPPKKKKLIGGAPTPLIPDHIIEAMHAASRASSESFNKVLGDGVDFISKDPTWGLIETAKLDAAAILEAETKQSREEAKRKEEARKKGATTVTSLKRMSMEITRLSLKNKTAVLAGVVSRYDDPELLALDSIKELTKKKGKGKNRRVSVSVREDDVKPGSICENSVAESSLSSSG